MAYGVTVWKNVENVGEATEETPKIDADALNKIEQGIAGSLPLAGGTMTGALNLRGEQTEDGEAVSKKYVDNNVIYISINASDVTSAGKLVRTIDEFSPDKYLFLCSCRFSTNRGLAFSFRTQNYGEVFSLADYSDADQLKLTTDGEIYVYYGGSTSGTVRAEIILIPCQKILIKEVDET